MKENVDEVETENKRVRGRRKKKAADIMEPRLKGSQLSWAARKVFASKKAVGRVKTFPLRKRRESDLIRYQL